jgi:hypothetical protein
MNEALSSIFTYILILFLIQRFVSQTVASATEVLVALLGLGTQAGDSEKRGRVRGSLEKRETSKYDEGQGDGGGTECWAVSYHLLVLLERLYTHLPAAADHAATHPLGTPSSSSKKLKGKSTPTSSALVGGEGVVVLMQVTFG